MTDRPIIFSGPMIRALLDGRKTQTRRLLKPPYGTLEYLGNGAWRPICTKFFPGDRLWVRESFNAFQFSQDGDQAWPVKKIPTLQECKEAEEEAYRYGAPQIVYQESDRARQWFAGQKWRPSIHMPRWASRLTLTVTEVRVQRLWQITNNDAISEGIRPQYHPAARQGGAVLGWGYDSLDGYGPGTATAAFAQLWNSLHGPEAWDANPWVAALTFTVRKGNIDQ